MKGWKLLWISAVLGTLAAAVSGCAPLTDMYQHSVAASRRPGREMVESPEKTVRRYCAPEGEDMLVLEISETLPERAYPGEEINHRLRYAMCARNPFTTVRGRVTRTVYYNGKAVFRDVTECRFAPGTWTVDAFIKIPTSAGTGWYALEVEVAYQKKSVNRVSSFFVKKG